MRGGSPGTGGLAAHRAQVRGPEGHVRRLIPVLSRERGFRSALLAPRGTAGAVVFAHSAAQQLRRCWARAARHRPRYRRGPAAQDEGRFCGGFVRFPAGCPRLSRDRCARAPAVRMRGGRWPVGLRLRAICGNNGRCCCRLFPSSSVVRLRSECRGVTRGTKGDGGGERSTVRRRYPSLHRRIRDWQRWGDIRSLGRVKPHVHQLIGLVPVEPFLSCNCNSKRGFIRCESMCEVGYLHPWTLASSFNGDQALAQQMEESISERLRCHSRSQRVDVAESRAVSEKAPCGKKLEMVQ
ncbi:uncharacterized protein LOC141923709 [Strix aluco]|uniref:uncharacterized protein LOC141923709 n=1 Tax=Strix aluco TaxID=111821 RepID=UPI003DA309CD